MANSHFNINNGLFLVTVGFPRSKPESLPPTESGYAKS